MPEEATKQAAVRAALIAVARHGLPGAPVRIGPPLDDGAWDSLLLSVRGERLAGVLDRAVADGALEATPEQGEAAEAVAAQSLRSVLQLERLLLAVAERLRRDGVSFRVLKGPAVARLDEPDPALRHYADLDLLVRSESLEDALSSLAMLGYHRDLPERRAGFDRRFAKEVSLANELGRELDLHRSLALGSIGLAVDLSALWVSSDHFSLGGQSFPALDAEGRFIHACITTMLGDERPRLVAVRDVARISASHDLRPERLRHLAPQGRGAAVVSAALGRCRSTLGVEVTGAAAAAFADTAASRWEKVALRAYRSQGGTNTLELLSGALAVRGTDRLAYLRALVLPDAAYLAARRSAGRPREWSTGVREVALRMVRRGKGNAGA